MNKKLIEPKSVTELYAYISTLASKLERKLNRLPEHSEEYKLAVETGAKMNALGKLEEQSNGKIKFVKYS